MRIEKPKVTYTKPNGIKCTSEWRITMELKPCPFCGGKVKILKRKRYKLEWIVGCQNEVECILGLQNMRDIVPWYSRKYKAIKAWNRRAKESYE